MKREVITYNEIEGFHKYANAPQWVGYLSALHRHIFVIRCWAEVSHNEREIEIITLQYLIEKRINNKYGKPAQFGDMSCESIAEWLLTNIPNLTKVEVLEDGFGGATLTR